MFLPDVIKKYAETDLIAWRGLTDSLSYRDLDRRSESFAGFLRGLPQTQKGPVVVYGHKEPEFLPCALGALKAGRAYVPVDSVLPPTRALEIAADVAPSVIADLSGGGLSLHGAASLSKTEVSDMLMTGTAYTPTPGGDLDRVNHLFFTSGSTGRPKGVPITRGNLAAFDAGLGPLLDRAASSEAQTVILDQVSYSFDVSCCSVYSGLKRGFSLFALERELLADLKLLYARLRESGLVIWVSTPSFAELCVRGASFSRELMPKLKMFLFCGEVLTHRLCDELAERFPGAAILNTYGPTEATVLVTAVEITREMRRDTRSIPIGAPLTGVKLVLDNNSNSTDATAQQEQLSELSGQAAADFDETGELLIIGDCVSPGYHSRDSLTAERFFTDEVTGKRGYRTGDICGRLGDNYYYQGRRDNQIKLNGYRVEIEDVENNLQKLDSVLKAAVVPLYAGEKVSELAAFVLLRQSKDGLSPFKRGVELKKQAALILPAYMLPRRFIALDSFPLNANGKTDRKALGKMLAEKTGLNRDTAP